MCDQHCIDFGVENITEDHVLDKIVLEIGARNVNGSLRSHVASMNPRAYIGIDICKGDCVDVICDAVDIASQFGNSSADLVISTEMIEHVYEWDIAIDNMKSVLRPGGRILITTRSIGFSRHDFPSDHWRFEEEDMKNIFSDYAVISIAHDRYAPGIFIYAMKLNDVNCVDLSEIKLYNVNRRERCFRI